MNSLSDGPSLQYFLMCAHECLPASYANYLSLDLLHYDKFLTHLWAPKSREGKMTLGNGYYGLASLIKIRMHLSVHAGKDTAHRKIA